jgi:hypothetical protein
MPAIATLLTLLGLVPMIVFAFGAVGHIPETAERMLVSLIDYAALILAFAGGVHWGLALLPQAARRSLRFGAGMLPMVLGWVALMLGQFVAPSVALAVLIPAYLATILTEHRAAKGMLVPTGYVWLRWVVSVVAVVAMVMVLILRGVGQTIVF